MSIPSLPLRELLRQPAKVKELTRRGQRVRITEHGRALWIMEADRGAEVDEAERIAASWDEALDELAQAVAQSHPLLSATQGLLDQRHATLR
jgi:hypothetical protein